MAYSVGKIRHFPEKDLMTDILDKDIKTRFINLLKELHEDVQSQEK